METKALQYLNQQESKLLKAVEEITNTQTNLGLAGEKLSKMKVTDQRLLKDFNCCTNLMRSRSRDLNQRIDSLQRVFSKFNQILKENQNHLKALGQEKQKRINKLQGYLKSKNTKIEKLEEKIKKNQSESSKKFKSQILGLNQQVTQLESLLDQTLKVSDQSQVEISQLKRQIQNLKKSLVTANSISKTRFEKIEELERTNQDLRDRLNQSNMIKEKNLRLISEKIGEINQQKSQISALQLQISSLEFQLSETKFTLEKSMDNESSLKTSIVKLQKRLSNNKRLEELKEAKIKRLTAKNEELKDALNEEENQKIRIQRLEEELASHPTKQEVAIAKQQQRIDIKDQVLRRLASLLIQIEHENQKNINESNIKTKDNSGVVLASVIDQLFVELGEPNMRKILNNLEGVQSSLARVEIQVKHEKEELQKLKMAKKKQLRHKDRVRKNIKEMEAQLEKMKDEYNDLNSIVTSFFQLE